MPKRKTEKVKIDEPSNKKSLSDNKTVNKDELPTINDELLNLTKEIDEDNEEGDLFIKVPLQYLLLNKLADNLELNEVINKNLEGDEIDRFREKIKKLVDKIFKEIKENINRQNIKKSKFVKAIIRIFSILLKANISSVKKIKKIIKQSARLVLNL